MKAKKVTTITVKTPQQAAQALHHVWPTAPKERRALVEMILEGTNVVAFLEILPRLGPRQAEAAILHFLPRLNIDAAFEVLRAVPAKASFSRARRLALGKVLRNPIRRWLSDNEQRLEKMPFLADEVDEMVEVVYKSRLPAFAFRLCALKNLEGRLLLDEQQRKRLRRLAEQYEH